MLSKIQEINQSIMFGEWTDVELSSMIDAIKFKRASLIKSAKYTLKVGTEVKFHSAKRGMDVAGKITKVAQKYATVSTANGLWKVPMNMLTVV